MDSKNTYEENELQKSKAELLARVYQLILMLETKNRIGTYKLGEKPPNRVPTESVGKTGESIPLAN